MYTSVLSSAGRDLAIVEAAFILLRRKSDHVFCETPGCSALVKRSIGRCDKHPQRRYLSMKRELAAVEMRESGMTFKCIGKTLGVSANRARQIFLMGNRGIIHYGSIDAFRSRVQHFEGWGMPPSA